MAANHFELELPIASDALVWCNSSCVEELIAASGGNDTITVRTVDVSQATCKSDVTSAIAKALDFPERFAGNWDSFEECLAEPDSLGEATHLVVAFHGANKLFTLRTEAETLFSIFRDVANEWRDGEGKMRLSVVLIGQADAGSNAVLKRVGIRSLS